MTAYADASDMPLLPPWVLILGALLALAAAMAIRAIRNAPVRDAEPSAWDERDGVRERCTVKNCRQHATVHVHAGTVWWPFCVEHGTPYLTQDMRGEAG